MLLAGVSMPRMCARPTAWAPAAIISSLAGLTSTGGCIYSIWKIKQIRKKLALEAFPEEERPALLQAQELHKILAWTFGIVGGVSLATAIICTYQWAHATPEFTEQDIAVINQVKSILGTRNTPTPQEIAAMLSEKQLSLFLQQIEDRNKCDLAAKKIQLLKYATIAVKSDIANKFHAIRKKLNAKESIKLFQTIEFDLTTHNPVKSKRHLLTKIQQANKDFELIEKLLEQLDQNQEHKKVALSSIEALAFFGQQFSVVEKEKMLEIAYNLAENYLGER